MAHHQLRELPAVSRLLAHPRAERLLRRFNHDYVVRACREALDHLRRAAVHGDELDPAALDADAILGAVESRLSTAGDQGFQRVVNATGTVLHTNLGRALLPQAAIDAVARAGAHPINLEYDVVQGDRGRREQVIEQLLTELTGAEAATVVNNNAAAVLLALNTVALGKEVIVSRGELVEIGGAFRIPEIMARSGVTLREVGTTNRTHAADYEEAITDRTALLLKVHTSNYRIVGFVAEVGLPELVSIGRNHGVPVMEDLGSGALVDLSRYGLPKEPVVADRIALGADLVTSSGDKVLGGPQAGLIAGTSTWVTQLARNPLHRALRCGKLTLAALEATLRLYRESAAIAADIPALRAFTRPIEEIDDTARQALPAVVTALGPGFRVSIDEIPTRVIVIEHDQLGAHHIAARFRESRPPIIGRIKDGRFLLDARTIFDPLELVPRWAG